MRPIGESQNKSIRVMTLMDAANSELTMSNNIRGRLVESQEKTEVDSYDNNKANGTPSGLMAKRN